MSSFQGWPIRHSDVGFDWGPLRVTRITDDERGGVYINAVSMEFPGLLGIDIRLSPKGRVMQIVTYGNVQVERWEESNDA